ncbi:ANTAR domain-containing protein [Streptomonospora litoralis]|uniref:ANTAR domain protein n=1 Tax=Streptomonospora litoralis TaxID=2498135 RepID=A0A4P6QAM1_9ACTN|nr:ANTAR domain-containing protein [Streptomonospora litoralis]QBI56609.1 ANTAR domain protein [Streptomonospora litoralis]
MTAAPCSSGAQRFNAPRSQLVIGQAKGILMERDRITAEEAVDRLMAASQATNVKLRDSAARMSAPGALDADP